MKVLIAALLAVSAGFAQYSDFSTQTASSNLSAAMNSKLATQTGASLPGTCTAGKDVYLKNDGTFHICTAANTWTELAPRPVVLEASFNLGDLPDASAARTNLGLGAAATKAVQGTDSNVMSAGTVSGTNAALCTDANGGATTTCPSFTVGNGPTFTGPGVAFQEGSGQNCSAGSAAFFEDSTTHIMKMCSNAVIDNAVGAATTNTLTNKTYDTAGTGNTFKVGGTSIAGLQGTDTKLLSAGTVSGTAATLCTDANGGATTVGCSGGGSSSTAGNGIAISGSVISAASLCASAPASDSIAATGSFATTCTIPAGALAVGSVIEIDAGGTVTGTGGGSYGPGFSIGATSMAAFVSGFSTPSSYSWVARATAVVTAIGASGAIIGAITGDPGSASGNAGGGFASNVGTSHTFNTTGTLALSLQFTLPGSDSATLKYIRVGVRN